MAVKGRLGVYFLILASAVLSLSALAAAKDPELKHCLRQCRQQEQYDERQRRMCEKQCEDSYGKKHGVDRSESGEESEENPYVFVEESFRTLHESEEGRIGVLQRFTERSSLLRGIENYRIAYLEANPGTFVIPSHLDADSVFYVAQGRASVKLVVRNGLQNVEVEEGHLLRVEAGTTTYIINKDRHEKLGILKLLRSESVPGDVQAFIGAGGENPQSFYKAFNEDLLAAALNTKKDLIRKVLGRQKKGAILKASEEQIRSMAGSREGGLWPFGSESRRSFNLLKKKPSKSNEHGKLHEADWEDYDQLRDLEMAISYANITRGSMAGPFYNSKATKLAVVIRGRGYLEIVCPHVSGGKGGDREKGSGCPTYRTISAQLRQGVVFVVPVGHPVAMVASSNEERSENLEVICFDVNHKGNERYTLAGKNNVIGQIEKAAKELAFNSPSREVDEMLQSQPEEFFFKGPQGWREPGIRAYV